MTKNLFQFFSKKNEKGVYGKCIAITNIKG